MANLTKGEVSSYDFYRVCVAGFCLFFSFNLILAELPSLLTDLGGADYLGFIIGMFTLSAAISRPFSGKMADVLGRKTVYYVGVASTIVASLLYSWLAVSVIMFLLVRFLHGFSAGFGPTATSALVADMSPVDKRGEKLGLLSLFTSAGLALGPSVGSYLRGQLGMDLVFVLASSIGVVGLLSMRGVNEYVEQEGRMRDLNWSDVVDQRVLVVGLNTVLVLFSFGMVLTLIPDFLVSLGGQNKGTFFTIYVLSSICVRYFMGQLSDKWGRESVLLVGNLIAFISMLLLLFVTDLYQLYAVGVIYGVAVGMNGPVTFAWAVDRCKGVKTGKALSTVFLFLEMGIGVGAFISGWLYAGDLQNLPLCFAVAAAFALMAFLYLLSYKVLDKS